LVSPLCLGLIFALGVYNLTQTEHKYAGVVPYPEWATYVGYGLILISAVQIPIWAALVFLYYVVRGRPGGAVRPTPQWGPGDKAVRRAILDEQSGIARAQAGKYAYDNYNYHM